MGKVKKDDDRPRKKDGTLDKRGRRSKYNAETFPLLAEGWARDGLSDQQVAANLRISVDRFYAYLKKYPKFSEALKRGKAPVDIRVENAMLKKAEGFEYDEKKITVVDGVQTVTITRKYFPPDVPAGKFWLTNRSPEKWAEKKDVSLTISPEQKAKQLLDALEKDESE